MGALREAPGTSRSSASASCEEPVVSCRAGMEALGCAFTPTFAGMPIDNKHIQALSQLEFKARQVVEGFLAGLHKSPFHGFSVEFAEHRAYNPGESTRHIDWKLYARRTRSS